MSSFLKDLKIYGLADFIAKIIALVVSPILTRMLSLEQFGAIALLNAVWQPVSLVRFGGMDSAYPFFQAEETDESLRDINIVTSTLVAMVFILGLVLLFVVAELFTGSISRYVGVSSSEFYWFSISLIPSGIIAWLIYILRFLRQAEAYVKVNIMGPILSSLLVLPALYFCLPSDRVIYYFVVASVVNFLAIIWATREFLRIEINPLDHAHFSKPVARKMLGYGLALVPAAVIYSLMTVVNRLQVGWYLGVDDTAVLQLAIMLSAVGSMMSGWFGLAFDPHLMQWISKLQKEEYTAKLQSFLNYLGPTFLLVSALSSIWSCFVISLLYPAKYFMAGTLVPLLLLAIAFSTISRIAIVTVIIARKPTSFIPARMLGLCICTMSGAYFIPRYGLQASAYGIFLGELAILGYWIYLGRFFYENLNLDWLKTVLLSVVTVYFCLVPVIEDQGVFMNNILRHIVTTICIGIFYMIFMGRLRIYTKIFNFIGNRR